MKKILLVLLVLPFLAVILIFGWRSWNGLNDGMAYPRSEIHAAVLDDKIYVAGGIGLFRVLDSCETYHISKEQWQPCPSLPRPLHHVAMAADDTHVYASGGYVALPFEQDQNAALFAHIPGRDSWRELAKLPNPIGQHAMFHREGILYLIGGQNGSTNLDSFWAYDLAANSWFKMPPMPTPRHSHAIAFSNDKLFISGGRSASLGSEISKIESFDFASGQWTTLPDMPTGRAGHGMTVSGDNLHLFGGESLSDSRIINQHEILDLATQKWTEGKAMAAPRHGFAFAQHVGDDAIHVIGGGAKPGLHTIYSVSSTTQKLDN